MSKNQSIVNFLNFLKNCRNFSDETFYSHFKLYSGPICAITSISFGWDLRNIAEKDQKTANCELFQFFQRLSTRFEQ